MVQSTNNSTKRTTSTIFHSKRQLNYFKWSRKSKQKISTLQPTIFLLALNNNVWICLFVSLDQQVEWSKIVTFEGSNIDKIAWPITRLRQPLGCYRVWVQIQSMSPFSLYWLIWFLTLGKETHNLWVCLSLSIDHGWRCSTCIHGIVFFVGAWCPCISISV